jgi:TonB family protein
MIYRHHAAARVHYYRRVEIGMACAVLVHAAAFALAPPYVARPFRLPAEPLLLLAEPSEPGIAAVAPPMAAAIPSRAVPEGISAVPIRSEQLEAPARTIAAGAGAPGGVGAGGGPAGGVAGGVVGGLAPPVYYAFDTAPRPTRRVEPEYPLAARIAGSEGTVIVNANVDERGRIMRAWVVESTAPGALTEAALDAAYQFEFEPGRQDGAPVKCTISIPFRFRLNKTTEHIGG